MQARNARIGLVLFLVYLIYYGGFVLVNAFSPKSMEGMPIDGVNYAIIHGFGLIISAFVLAFIYGVLCKSPSKKDTSENAAPKEGDEK